MPVAKSQTELSFFALYDRFIQDNKRGKRLQPNGKKVSSGTIANYVHTKRVIEKFCTCRSFQLRIRIERQLNTREREKEKNYWKQFYKKFSDYLYDYCGYCDNYGGLLVKNIRVFFNYLNKDLVLGVGEFHKSFYVRKHEKQVVALMPEELNYIIYNQEFEESLSPRMKQVKDVFVFGCTVALRVSDLLALKKANIRVINNHYYLTVRSIKTDTDTLIKLPE